MLPLMDMQTDKASNARKHSALSIALADQLRAEVAVAKITVRDLARKSGVPERTLARLLSGERTIDVAQLDMLCRALDIAIPTMLARANARAAEANKDPGEQSEVSGG